MEEEWRPVVVWGGWFSERYEVSNLGRVRSNPNFMTRGSRPGKILFQSHDNHGYPQVYLCKDMRRTTVKVHHLVGTAFLGYKAPGVVINHIDSNKRNNNVTNLEYCSQKCNTRHYNTHSGTYSVMFFGENIGIPEAVERYAPEGVKKGTVQRRIFRHGWTPEDAVTTPLQRTGRPTDQEVKERKKLQTARRIV